VGEDIAVRYWENNLEMIAKYGRQRSLYEDSEAARLKKNGFFRRFSRAQTHPSFEDSTTTAALTQAKLFAIPSQLSRLVAFN
jgi:hypothetical protein